MAKKKGKSKRPKQSSQPNPSSATNSINEEVIAAALTSANQPILIKMCRLCETKDGPFLNIFDPDTLTAKKIQDLMPFSILENDDLPHKICFRCSAKVEELHEFVQKCIRTQDSLKATQAKNKSLVKTKHRTQWEEQLNKSNISNDDICNALIKKAMEGIKDMPLHSLPVMETKASSSKATPPPIKSSDSPLLGKKEVPSDTKSNLSIESDVVLKKVQLSVEKCDSKPVVTRKLRSKNSDNNDEKTNVVLDKHPSEEISIIIEKQEDRIENKMNKTKINISDQILTNNESTENKVPNKEEQPKVNNTKPFNIMDHITTIKVNGVGILFQCTLCNRNFLKKEVVEVHGCAKTGSAKTQIPKPLPPPEPPKMVRSVKYIDSKKVYSADNDLPKSEPNAKTDILTNTNKSTEITSKTEIKTKPKIGPASKVKRNTLDPPLEENSCTEKQNSLSHPKTSSESSLNSENSIVNFPSVPSLSSRYKLVPGPNNSFTLIEESSLIKKMDETTAKKAELKKKILTNELNRSKDIAHPQIIIDLDNDKPSSSKHQPYPVGLFQTTLNRPNLETPPAVPEAPKFTTTTKKQSYTVVQTGDPSKLVISTKQTIVEEIPKKRLKKIKTDASESTGKEPFSVTLEDVAPPKDSGFFTFINVDPLLQPSYVLPTDNIIQESQISTSTPAVTNKTDVKEKDKYSCSMCSESFSREKKLLTHIQSHYAKLDEEDDVEEINQNKKRRRKS